jgi:4-hydroxybenzoate polyprenyltransferase
VEKFFGFLRLMRPANIVTAIADILAGIAISGFFLTEELHLFKVSCLILATIGLYGGGVVFNDVFDAELDRRERPERPIPSGLVEIQEASLLGSLLLLTGICAAFFVSMLSGVLAAAIAVAALVYDKWGKHQAFLGPINMGLCRGLNLLLGISIITEQLYRYWLIGLIPLIYIAAVTMVSRGEVHGGKKNVLYGAVFLYAIVISAIGIVAYQNDHILGTAVIIVFWAFMIFIPLKKAIDDPKGPRIGKAVKAGVIALILMNAAWAASFGMINLALAIIVLLPLSLLLARVFAVT